MPPVIHVIPVVDVINVNLVSFIPGGRPVFRPRINHAEPEATVLEPRVSGHDDYRDRVNTEPVSTAKMRAEVVFGNTVASVTPAFAPAMMFMLPMVRAMALPNFSPPGMIFMFVPVCFAHVFRAMRLLVMRLMPFWFVVSRPLLLVVFLRPLGFVFVPML